MGQSAFEAKQGRAAKAASKLQSLQILRALAAFSVVVGHALHETEKLGANTQQPPILGAGWNLGYGVDIFFVLSGFIMMHTAARDFGTEGASRRFLLRRCARVVPLYWLLTTTVLVGGYVLPSLINVPVESVYHVVASYLFIPDARAPGEVRPVMALGWTLNYEMLFYAIFSVALLLRLRLGVALLTGLMLVVAATHPWVDPANIPVAFWTSPLVLEFLFGVHVALIHRAGVRLGAPATLALLAFGLTGFVRVTWPYDEAALPQFLWAGLPAAALVLAAAIGPALPLNRVALWGVALGDASYSLYLAHPFVLRPERVIWEKLVGAHLPMSAFVVTASLGSVAFALLLYRFVETPLTAGAQRLVDSRGAKRVSAERMAGAVRTARV